jgi:opacity protein-like surface antigen
MNRLATNILLVLALALLVAACASGPKVYTNRNPDVDLSQYRTFGYSGQLGTDRTGGQRSILSTNLIRATTAELEKRGYRYVESEPDIEVNFYLHTQEKIRSSTTPTAGIGYGGGYYGYRTGYYGTWGGYETTVSQYTEGTLTVDLIDNARDVLAWEGTAVGRLSEKVRANLEEATTRVIGEVMANYPAAN